MMYPPAGLPKDMVEPTIGGSDYWANKVRMQYRKTNPEQVRREREEIRRDRYRDTRDTERNRHGVVARLVLCRHVRPRLV